MIELSADLGEGSAGEDALWPLIDRASVACGGHAGDDASMRDAAQRAQQHGVILGAHPSYPDRENFGRRSVAMSPEPLRDSLIEQLRTLASYGDVRHVKPHGALYNDAHHDRARALTIVEALLATDASVALVAPDASEMAAVAREHGVAVVREAFADRRYAADGTLVPRSIAGSTLSVEESVEQATLLARDGVVFTAAGTCVAVAFDTLCIHADMSAAFERLKAIRAALGR